ncbi:MAG: DUF1549 domain-containing protein, partial [Pirellulales bacterium]
VALTVAGSDLPTAVGDGPTAATEGATATQRPADAELSRWLDGQFSERMRPNGGLPPMVDDATFLRRAYLDLAGVIPSVSRARDFLAEKSPDKRMRLIQDLLASRRCDEHLARIWRRMMIPVGSPGAMAASQFDPWLARQFRDDVSYDELARRVVTGGTGSATEAPAAFYRAVGGTPDALAESLSRMFLGVRLGCAQCHDHPFASWNQADFWGMAAFFAGANLSGQPQNGNEVLPENKPGTIRSEDGTEYTARFPWGSPAAIPAGKRPREVLADWLASPENPNFAATAVNRVWQHLCGRGLIDPVDDLDQATPEDRQLLNELAARFAASGFDLDWLTRGICGSRFYQQPSGRANADGLAGGENPTDGVSRPLKTLTPEQVFDSLEQALLLPVARGDDSARHNGQREEMVGRLEEGFGGSPEEYRAGIPQVLLMMNGKLTAAATDLDSSRTLRAVIEAPFLDATEKINTLYLAVLTRNPRPTELNVMLEHVQQAGENNRKQSYAEIFWALLNSPEFVLCP